MRRTWTGIFALLLLLVSRSLFGDPAAASPSASTPAASQSTSTLSSPAVSGAGSSGIDVHLYYGLLAHDVPYLWSGFPPVEGGFDMNFEADFVVPGWSRYHGSFIPIVGLTLNSIGDTSKIYAGVVWQYESPGGFVFRAGLGAALHNGHLKADDPKRKALGSRVLFRIPIEVGWKLAKHLELTVFFAHVSNGFLALPNEGLDDLGVRYGF